jgi:hypothetical protein
VIITIKWNKDEIETMLDTALLTPEEMVEWPEGWVYYTDKFPKWNA